MQTWVWNLNEKKKDRVAQTTSEKNKVGQLVLPDFKIQGKVWSSQQMLGNGEVGREEMFWGDKYIHYLDCEKGFISVFLCQTPQL